MKDYFVHTRQTVGTRMNLHLCCLFFSDTGCEERVLPPNGCIKGNWGAWVAQCSGHEIGPRIGLGEEPAWDSVSPSPSPYCSL